jgi:hypothetical protein
MRRNEICFACSGAREIRSTYSLWLPAMPHVASIEVMGFSPIAPTVASVVTRCSTRSDLSSSRAPRCTPRSSTLRHQLAVVHRSRRPRVDFTSADRILWARLARAWRAGARPFTSSSRTTVIAWHRRGFRLFWTWKSRHPAGRSPDVRALIRELFTANPLWGAPKQFTSTRTKSGADRLFDSHS